MSILSSQIHDLKNLAGRIDDTHDRKTITDAAWTIEQLSEKARVVHAHWIEEDGIQICSNCGEEHEWEDYRADHCDTCGAKMDESVSE